MSEPTKKNVSELKVVKFEGDGLSETHEFLDENVYALRKRMPDLEGFVLIGWDSALQTECGWICMNDGSVPVNLMPSFVKDTLAKELMKLYVSDE